MADTPNVPIYDEGFEELRGIAERTGGFFQETQHHVLAHLPGRDRLVVGFDNLASVNDLPRRVFGQPLIRGQGWGALGILVKRKDWFRDAALFDALERIAADGLFRSYPEVSFYGASMGGFAALTFCRLSPGATVLAFAPQSTLAPDLAPFENRYRFVRRFTDWSGPYRDAAEGVSTARTVQIVYDPTIPQDAAHASRIAGPNVQLLPCAHLTHKVPPALRRMNLLKEVTLAGLHGSLDRDSFARMMRGRRNSIPWTVAMLEHAAAHGHARLALRVLDARLEKDDHWKLRQLRPRLRALRRSG